MGSVQKHRSAFFIAAAMVAAVAAASSSGALVGLLASAGILFSLMAHEVRGGGAFSPIPALCWLSAVNGGAAAGVLTAAASLIIGIGVHYRSENLRNTFISLLPACLLITFFSGSVPPHRASYWFLLVPAGALLQLSTLWLTGNFQRSRTASDITGWVVNGIAGYTVFFFLRIDGFAGALLVVLVLLLFASLESREGRSFSRFSSRIDTLSLQNRLTSLLFQEEAGYLLYYKDRSEVWTMQGKPAPDNVRHALDGQPPSPEWSLFSRNGTAFAASGNALSDLEALPEEDLQETLRILETVWKASFNRRRMENAFMGAAGRLVRIADRKDSDTHRHSVRVSQTSAKIGAVMGLSTEDIFMLRTAALLHDIGKLAIPGRLVMKKGLLTEDERRIIETHPEEGARLLAPMERYDSVISVVLQHHERIDGSGYPMGLRGHEMSLHARIVAVADAFDAITSPRAYHLGKPTHIAMREIMRHRGAHFDAAVVDALEEMLS